MIKSSSVENSRVKFIDYTGRYPNLCSGVLTLEIDGKIYKFGYEKNMDVFGDLGEVVDLRTE